MKHNNYKNFEKIIVKAYRDYCAHLSEGYPKRAWSFFHKELPHGVITYKLLERFVKDIREKCPEILEESALASGYKYWLEVVKDGAIGNNKDVNAKCISLYMQNVHRWNSNEVDDESVNKIDEAIESLKSIKLD